MGQINSTDFEQYAKTKPAQEETKEETKEEKEEK